MDTGIAETFDTITPRVLVSNDLVHSKSVLEENKIHEYFGKEVEDILQGLNVEISINLYIFIFIMVDGAKDGKTANK